MTQPASPKTVAIMQPYLFPYIGYFQLAAQADRFVFLNDANYIKGGWINRNRLRVNGEPWMFTVPLHRPSQNSRIDESTIQLDERFLFKFMRTMKQFYARAPHLDAVVNLCDEVFRDPSETIDQLASRSVCLVFNYLALPLDCCDAKDRYNNKDLAGEERVIDIVKQEQGTRYLNLPGGRELYDEARFTRVGITLKFIEPINEPYPQASEPYLPFLSILDVLLWNDRQTVCRWLES